VVAPRVVHTPWLKPTRSAMTVAFNDASRRSNSLIAGTNGSTFEPVASRTYSGGLSYANALATVSRAISNRLAI